MTTTSHQPAAGAPSPNGVPGRTTLGTPRQQRTGPVVGERVPVPPRQRRPALAALGVLVVLGCAGISGALVLGSGQTTTVLTVTRAVPAGHVMTDSDLATAEISGTGPTAIAAASGAAVVGKTAAVDLVPGTLLTTGMLTSDRVPRPSQAVVGLALEPGLLPVAELAPGTRVMVVRVPAAAGQQPAAGTGADAGTAEDVLVPEATVLSVGTDQTSGGRLVSLVVDKDAAATVARAGAVGTVSLVVIAAG